MITINLAKLISLKVRYALIADAASGIVKVTTLWVDTVGSKWRA